MLITRETDYAVRCVLYLAQKTDQRTIVDEIAKCMQIPKHYLAKILQRLVREGIVESVRGIKGGYRLLKPPKDISVMDILGTIQGAVPVNVCALDKRRCQMSSACSVHPIWVDIRKDIETRLKHETIDKLMKTKKRS
ncbi:MAG: RrF2 family transcriptional regulator [Nitrospirota bacterium]